MVAPPPNEIANAAKQAREFITRAISFDVDDTPETLSAVDHYLSQVPADQAELSELVASAVGCYFGEVLRAHFGGEWILPSSEPATWRLRLASFELQISPVGLVHQAITRGQSDERFDDSFHLPHPDEEFVRRRLESVPGVTEEVYYTLCNRYDTLQLIIDTLIARHQSQE
jgi:hypothetical protein